jgi:hypothetical protein
MKLVDEVGHLRAGTALDFTAVFPEVDFEFENEFNFMSVEFQIGIISILFGPLVVLAYYGSPINSINILCEYGYHFKSLHHSILTNIFLPHQTQAQNNLGHCMMFSMEASQVCLGAYFSRNSQKRDMALFGFTHSLNFL